MSFQETRFLETTFEIRFKEKQLTVCINVLGLLRIVIGLLRVVMASVRVVMGLFRVDMGLYGSL